MGLKEKIADDMKKAMKAGEKTRLETLRTLKAALMEKEIHARGEGKEMSAADDVAVVVSMAKKRRESIDLFTKGNRPELAAQEQRELEIIQEYLPTMMTQEEIEQVIDRAMKATGASSASDFSKVMPLVMKEARGKADGKQVQEMVRRRLAGTVPGGLT
jgi:uncharacterized protein YqeY